MSSFIVDFIVDIAMFSSKLYTEEEGVRTR